MKNSKQQVQDANKACYWAFEKRDLCLRSEAIPAKTGLGLNDQ